MKDSLNIQLLVSIVSLVIIAGLILYIECRIRLSEFRNKLRLRQQNEISEFYTTSYSYLMGLASPKVNPRRIYGHIIAYGGILVVVINAIFWVV